MKWNEVRIFISSTFNDMHAERDYLITAGWIDEGIAFHAEDSETGVPQYRLYNPNAACGAHHYTADIKERDYLITAGWRDEGIGFYALS